MFNLKINFFDNDKLAKRFSLTFLVVSILGVISLDYIVKTFFQDTQCTNSIVLVCGVIFMLFVSGLLYFMINHMQKTIRSIDNEYKKLKKQDQDKFALYEFALDNSVDSIHWFDMEGKFIYVNNATCKLDGYTKEEFKELYLEDIDPNFTRESAKKCMLDIKYTPNWRIETTHRKKDGTIYPIEVSGHGIVYEGKDYLCAFARDMTQRTAYRNKITTMNKELKKSVDEKEILLKEIHHRVKNNMEIISSLLNMQADRSSDQKFKDAMKESRSKIHAMALVHEFLYLGENLAYINVHEYIHRLIEDIQELYISNNTKLEVDMDIDKLEFSINRCIQVGMVLHELCVNALKYAFKEDRDNLLCIHMKLVDDERIHIKIRDNGDGLESLEDLNKKDSIGMQLIHSIVDFQLYGTIKFLNNKGLECNIEFPKKEIK